MASRSHREPITSAIEAYRQFGLRAPGWIEVELAARTPEQAAA